MQHRLPETNNILEKVRMADRSMEQPSHNDHAFERNQYGEGRLAMTNRALFIVGPSRSGTSVLAQALGRHPRILATEELHYYNLLQPMSGDDRTSLWARLEEIQHRGRFFEIKNNTLIDLREPDPKDLPHLSEPVLRAFLERLAKNAGAAAFVEQTPMNLYYMGKIREDFPGVLFVVMSRDPRAIIASQKMRWKVGSLGNRHHPEKDLKRFRYAGHPILQLLLLRKTLRVMQTVMDNSDVVSVSYENLVTNPVEVLSQLVARLGLEDDPRMLDVSDEGSSHAAEGQRTGFDPTRLDGWRKTLTQTEIWLTEKLYYKALILPATGERPLLREAMWLALSLPWAAMMAMYYSAGSYGNLVDAVRRRFL